MSGLWKAAAIVLLAALLLTGAGWALAAHDRDVARVDLGAERTRNDELRTSIREQNRAVETMGTAKALAEARGQAAQQAAAATGKRFDGALQRLVGARATTCAEAMPAVNLLLESVR
ncbi:MAG: hypothetical protein V4724_26440 [Pseudomonadota bacterium]